jgi:hypothetical protein
MGERALDGIADLLKLPARIFAAIAAVAGLILFVPATRLTPFGLDGLAKDHRLWVGLVFLLSVALLVAEVCVAGWRKLREWRTARQEAETRDRDARAKSSQPIGVPMLDQPPQPPPPVPGDFKPTDNQRRALTYLLHVYPSLKYLNDLHQHTRCMTPAHTEAEIRGLLDANVMMRETSNPSTFYGLTEAGKAAAMKWCKDMTPHPREKPSYYG